MQKNQPITVIAHRGGPGEQAQKENSLSAIKRSLEMPVAAIEVDVWQVDGQLIVFHDRRLNRFTNSDKHLQECSYHELRQLAQKNGFDIPTLAQVIDAVAGRALLNIEIKGPDCGLAVCQLIDSYVKNGTRCLSDFVISSFDQLQLKACLEQFPDIKRGLIICGIPLDLARQAQTLECDFLGLSVSFIHRDLIEDCHRRNIEAWVYTVNHPADIHWLIELGADGIFTDYPDRAFNAIQGER